jgi:translation initiation factor 1
MSFRPASSSLVYSTDGGSICPLCRQAQRRCLCQRNAGLTKPALDGVVRVSRETKGRAGKGVTLVRGLALDSRALIALGKQLKTACGSGGTVKNGVIEIQGEHRDRVLEILKSQGHIVKIAGA